VQYDLNYAATVSLLIVHDTRAILNFERSMGVVLRVCVCVCVCVWCSANTPHIQFLV
jgi:hypothetical protein